jgi:hypothetical protein
LSQWATYEGIADKYKENTLGDFTD